MGKLSIDDHHEKMNNIIMHFYNHEQVDQKRLALAKECIDKLKKCIQEEYLDIELEPYGSMVSGFGSKDSDADFSFCFKKGSKLHNEVQSDEQKHKVLEEISDLVSKVQPTWDVEFIDAKIPIVTFMWKALEVDISFHNESALANTELLQHYCKWDPRLPVLGFFVKKWAKAFNICSKKNGTLSSYTYCLMCIHYLHRAISRIMPCLHTDFKQLPQSEGYYKGPVISNWANRKKSKWQRMRQKDVAELFLGFLKYFAKFKYGKRAVHIQTRNNMEKYRLNGETSPIVVLDSIEKDVNITSHVSKKHLNYIVSTMRMSVLDVENWLKGEAVISPIMKELFNFE